MSDKHTPGPWEPCILDKPLADIPAYVEQCIKASGGADFYFLRAIDPEHGPVDVAHLGNGPRGEANARRIVQCVNAHDDLIATLRHFLDYGYDRDIAIAAIAKATEGKQ